MQLLVSDAIILRHIDYGEADRVVTFYTPQQGRCKGFARGARNSRKRFGAALEPFAQVRVHWSPAKGNGLPPLREVELVDLRVGLRSDLLALTLAGYSCELVEELVGDDPGHPDIYLLLQAFLDHLASAGPSPTARLLFELRLLHQIGYVPHLLHCSDCFGPLPDEVVFDPHRGGSLCAGCAPAAGGVRLGLTTVGSLARLLRSPLRQFSGISLGARTLVEGGAALAAALNIHLQRPLRSLRFLREISRTP